MFKKLISLISEYVNDDFFEATEKLRKFIYQTKDFEKILEQIGVIPESISLDSKVKKYASKS